MAGVLGIGADIRALDTRERAEAAGWIARYKEIRDVVTHGEVHLIGGPDQARCAVQYTAPDERRWSCWPGTPAGSTAPALLPVRARSGCRCAASTRRPATDTATGTTPAATSPPSACPCSGAPTYDADLIVLTRD